MLAGGRRRRIRLSGSILGITAIACRAQRSVSSQESHGRGREAFERTAAVTPAGHENVRHELRATLGAFRTTGSFAASLPKSLRKKVRKASEGFPLRRSACQAVVKSDV